VQKKCKRVKVLLFLFPLDPNRPLLRVGAMRGVAEGATAALPLLCFFPGEPRWPDFGRAGLPRGRWSPAALEELEGVGREDRRGWRVAGGGGRRLDIRWVRDQAGELGSVVISGGDGGGRRRRR
jgi:hypothetical protein